MARPTILNDQLIENFCLQLRLSGSIETAIAQTGCGHESFYRWKRLVRDGIGTKLQRRFMKAIEASLAEIKMRAEYLLSKSFDKSWRALAWWLERKYPAEYGRKRPLPALDPDPPAEQVRIDRIIANKHTQIKFQDSIGGAKLLEASAGVFEAVERVFYMGPRRLL